MERKHHKKHRSGSADGGDHKRKKHKRRRSDSQSDTDEEDQRKKHHKHRHDKERRRQHHSEDENDKRVEKRHRRNNGDHQSRDSHFDGNIRIKQEKDDENFRQQQQERSQNEKKRKDHRRDRDRDGGDHGLNTETRVKTEGGEEIKKEEEERQQPNFELSGKLTEDTNTFRGVVIKYNEPPEAMKPKRRWRLYPFKGEEALPVLHIHRQSAFLLGRERRIADIPIDHPSCSKQHAVLQFRALPYTRPDGTPGRRVRPYVIDLESANGTYVNGERVEPRRYYELREKDVVKFGFSSREYVVLHDSVDVSEVGGEDMEEA